MIYIFELFYFAAFKRFILLNLLNSEMKRLFSDGFNTAAIGNSLTKSHNTQALSCNFTRRFFIRFE